jgi:hypothetical protein
LKGEKVLKVVTFTGDMMYNKSIWYGLAEISKKMIVCVRNK